MGKYVVTGYSKCSTGEEEDFTVTTERMTLATKVLEVAVAKKMSDRYVVSQSFGTGDVYCLLEYDSEGRLLTKIE